MTKKNKIEEVFRELIQNIKDSKSKTDMFGRIKLLQMTLEEHTKRELIAKLLK